MSAYICNPETFETIINGLAYGRTTYGDLATYQGRAFRELPSPYRLRSAPQSTGEQLEFLRLAADLYRLNVRAVDQRYTERNEIDFPRFQLSPMRVRPLIQIYKSTLCLIYQCSEGDVPGTPLYKALERFSDRLAHSLVDSMPEYETAKWG